MPVTRTGRESSPAKSTRSSARLTSPMDASSSPAKPVRSSRQASPQKTPAQPTRFSARLRSVSPFAENSSGTLASAASSSTTLAAIPETGPSAIGSSRKRGSPTKKPRPRDELVALSSEVDPVETESLVRGTHAASPAKSSGSQEREGVPLQAKDLSARGKSESALSTSSAKLRPEVVVISPYKPLPSTPAAAAIAKARYQSSSPPGPSSPVASSPSARPLAPSAPSTAKASGSRPLPSSEPGPRSPSVPSRSSDAASSDSDTDSDSDSVSDSASDAHSGSGSTSESESDSDVDEVAGPAIDLIMLLKASAESYKNRNRRPDSIAFGQDENIISLDEVVGRTEAKGKAKEQQPLAEKALAGLVAYGPPKAARDSAVSGLASTPRVKNLDKHIEALDHGKLTGGVRASDPTSKQPAAKATATAGRGWFDMPEFGASNAKLQANTKRSAAEAGKSHATGGDARVATAEQLRKEVQAIRLRNALDPKRFYRGGGKDQGMPKFAQLGKIIASPLEPKAVLNRRERGRTVVEELIRDAEASAYAKRKFAESQERSASGRHGKGKRARKHK